MGACNTYSSKQINDTLNSHFSMNMVCSIWNKESHGLFDYESKNSNKVAIRIQNSGGLLKNKKQITFTKEDFTVKKNIEDPNSKLLFQIINSNFGYVLDSKSFQITSKDELGLNDNSVWQVIKSSKENNQSSIGYKLSVGDYIKLGRVRFRVKSFKGNSCEHGHKDYKEEVITQGDNLEDIAALNRKKEKESLEIISAKDNINNLNGNNKENLPSASNLNLACRICLEKNESEDNPLLTPCKCAGTMKFIHLQCLQKWLRGRTVIKQNNVSTTIIYKSLSCELCKSIFPEFLNGENGKKYPTLEIQMPINNFIVLEILNRDNNVPKGLHIVDMKTKQNIRIGRAHDSDLRFSDISVSRTHAIIHFNNGSFYIEDNKSKFGTLVLLRHPIQLKKINVKSFSIQIESTNINFQNIIFSKQNRCCGFKCSTNENTELSEGQKTREFTTLPDNLNQPNGVNHNAHDFGDLNSHDLAIHLDNHMNNSIIIGEEVINQPNNDQNIIANPNQINLNNEHQNNEIILPNAPININGNNINNININNENQENNMIFHFDSENEENFDDNISADFREGGHNIPISDSL